MPGSSDVNQEYVDSVTQSDDVTRQSDMNPESVDSRETEVFDISSATSVLNMLRMDPKCNNKNQWNAKTPHDIQTTMGAYNLLKTFRDVELKIVVRFLRKTKGLKINESDSKQVKLNRLCQYLKIEPEHGVNPTQAKKTTKPIKVKTLSDMAYDVMNKNV